MRPCPICKTSEHIRIEPDTSGAAPAAFAVSVYCAGCYDADCGGDPPRYFSRAIVARGRDAREACIDWDERVADEDDPEAGDMEEPMDLEDRLERLLKQANRRG